MVARTYRCAKCGDEFESDWSEEDAAAESVALWGQLPKSALVVVCDTCFTMMTKALPPAQWRREQES